MLGPESALNDSITLGDDANELYGAVSCVEEYGREPMDELEKVRKLEPDVD